MELKDELKKNPQLSEVWGKYQKTLEEIDLINLELLGKVGDIDVDKRLSVKEVDLINKWKELVKDTPMAKGLNIIRLAETIILDKMMTKDRLYLELKERMKEMMDVMDMLKKEEPKKEEKKEIPEYKIIKEDEKEIEKIRGEYEKAKKDKKNIHQFHRGRCRSIRSQNKDDLEEMSRLLVLDKIVYNKNIKPKKNQSLTEINQRSAKQHRKPPNSYKDLDKLEPTNSISKD